MTHRFGDLYAAPGLTNFLGCVQVDIDIMGIRSLNFPPIATSDVVTGGLYLNRRYFPSTGTPVKITWQPDRIERVAEYDGLRLHSTTILTVGKAAVVVKLQIENLSEGERQVELRFGIRGGVTSQVRTWDDALPPCEYDHKIEVDRDRRAVILEAKASSAFDVQGLYPPADSASPGALDVSFTLKGGRRWQTAFVRVLSDSRAEALETFDSVSKRAEQEIDATTRDWNLELESAFTPDNDRYSGCLPMLETSDEAIRRLYYMGALGVIYFKRDSPHSAIGRSYDTLMPKYWQSVTFLWDYSLSSLVHSLLDPVVMRKYLGRFMATDMHKHFGIEWLTGGPVGPWYSVNDYAMIKTARDYLRFNGDFGWLDEEASGSGQTALEHLRKYASSWESFKTPSGLADYGGIGNLLECVSSYVHEVASLNAANVYSLRTIAELLAHRGESQEAKELEAQASELFDRVMELYLPGRGYFVTRYPDASTKHVMHCYDFLTVLNTIDGDLSDAQKNEMTAFFMQHLKTPTWMRALSCEDDDAMFSVRPDHQWTGAYPAWPPMSALGMYRIGRIDEAFEWVRGMAASANQGPFGQAHFAEDAFPPEEGGARKAPADFPYINDWSCSSNGAWVSLVIEGIFGVDAGFGPDLSSSSRFGSFDREARLVNLPYRGGLYDVDVDGVRPSGRG